MKEITLRKFKNLVLLGIYFIDLFDNLEHKTYPNKSSISSVVTQEELFHDAINIMISLHNTCNTLLSCFSLVIYDFRQVTGNNQKQNYLFSNFNYVNSGSSAS